jgi:hypothetical protein
MSGMQKRFKKLEVACKLNMVVPLRIQLKLYSACITGGFVFKEHRDMEIKRAF